MLLDLLFLTLALSPLLPISRFRWRDVTGQRNRLPAPECCLYMDIDEEACFPESCAGAEHCEEGLRSQGPEALTLHPQHS